MYQPINPSQINQSQRKFISKSVQQNIFLYFCRHQCNRMRKIPLHWQIIIGLVLGFAWGFFAIFFGFADFTIDYIKPFGTIFINLLKLLAIPLIIASLIVGISNLHDVKKLGSMGGKTVGLYLLSTAIAVFIGLTIVNLVQPGDYLPEERRIALQEKFGTGVTEKVATVEMQRQASPLQPMINLIPENIFGAMGNNANMLQIVVFSIFLGVVLILIPDVKSNPVVAFFDGINYAILKMIDLVMYVAPYGVFALIAALMAEFAGDDPAAALDLLSALAMYSLTVVAGLVIMALIVYPLVLKFFTGINPGFFFKGILPAQMLAFSTSSSAATLPVTMERCEKKLGIPEEVTGFVLPLGATINMDGTSLYQAVATVFIAQAFGFDLSFSQQLTVVLTATLASIGAAGVPGAGMIMLVIVLQSVGLDPAGIALIIAVDRILDMCRTVVNVTGDATVCTLIAHSEKKLKLSVEE
jgi:Na+/H+-dicarboxylate symporter